MYGSYALLSGRRGYVRRRPFGMVETIPRRPVALLTTLEGRDRTDEAKARAGGVLTVVPAESTPVAPSFLSDMRGQSVVLHMCLSHIRIGKGRRGCREFRS